MIRTVIVSLLLFVVSCATTSAPTIPSPPIWAGLQPGTYAVGFRSRLLQTPPHPLQISVWYPAESGGPKMGYRDYLLMSLHETSADEPTQAQRDAGVAEFTRALTSAGLSEETVRTLIETPMYAHRDARPLTTKRFPVVFIAQGNNQTATAQAVLSEFVASHGYVVVTIPSITRLAEPMKSEGDMGAKSWEQAQDIERAVPAIADFPNAMNAPVLLVGHSFGARGALMYAMHHPAKALVSLDGGIGTAAGAKSMMDVKEMDLRASIPPVLHFYELNDDRMNPDFRMLRSLRTPDLQIVRMNSMQHVHFTTDGFGAVMLPDLAKATKAGADLKSDVVSVAQQTLAFLDKYSQSTR
jgi:dienelactone hydrolase